MLHIDETGKEGEAGEPAGAGEPMITGSHQLPYDNDKAGKTWPKGKIAGRKDRRSSELDKHLVNKSQTQNESRQSNNRKS